MKIFKAQPYFVDRMKTIRKKSYASGDRGAAMLIAVIFFLSASLLLVAGVSTPLLAEAQRCPALAGQ